MSAPERIWLDCGHSELLLGEPVPEMNAIEYIRADLLVPNGAAFEEWWDSTGGWGRGRKEHALAAWLACAAHMLAQAQSDKYKCSDCGCDLNEGEGKTFTVCDSCWDKNYQAQPAKDDCEDCGGNGGSNGMRFSCCGKRGAT